MTAANRDRISFAFVSLGCAKNLVDSQIMAGRMISSGFVPAVSPSEAEIVVVNTCAFIESARTESEKTVESVCGLKTNGSCRAVIVAGCYPQRYGKNTVGTMPEADAFVGLDELDEIGEIAARVLREKGRVIQVSPESVSLFEPEGPCVVFTGGPYAYLKIAEGCDHRCAFCAIPAIRGKHRSRTPESLLREAEILVKSGMKELNLISQDTTAYGGDLPEPADLTDLVSALCRLEGDFRIRILYGHPDKISDRLLRMLSEQPRVCSYLDVPLQHSHPDILRKMRRNPDDPGLLVKRIRQAVPDIVLRTTFMVGFPGETETHFRRLLDFVKETEFDRLGAFVFCPEENTPAFDMTDRPPFETAVERRERLMALQREIVERKNNHLTGTETEILLERSDPDNDNVFTGRSREQAPEVDGVMYVENVPADRSVGDIVRAKITGHHEYDLKAVCINR